MFGENTFAAKQVRKKLHQETLRLFHNMSSERRKQEMQWYLNLHFLQGNHYVHPRTVAGGQYDFRVAAAPKWRVRAVVNQIRKIVRRDITRLTKQRPNAYVVPQSIENRDLFAAQAGEAVWDYIWRNYNFEEELELAVFWQVVTGTGYIKQFWDASKIDKFNQVPGDLSIFAETPFHLYVPDLMLPRMEDQPFIIHAQTRNKKWLERTFGVEISLDKSLQVDSTLQSVLGVGHQQDKTNVLTLEVMAKPGYFDELPEGGMFTIAGDMIVQGYEGWPFEHGEYPFSKLDGIPSGKFYAASVLEDLIPLQRELNRTRSQIVEAKNKMGKPQLMAQEGSINPRRITSEPGLTILYKMGFQPPTPLPLQDLPAYISQELDRIYTDMADISGQHEVSQGSVPPGVSAATAIAYLQEQDETILSNSSRSIERAIEKTARQCLSMVVQYWDDERKIKTVGLDGSFDIQALSSSDLRGGTDIRVEGGSALPQSKAARQAFIMDLMNNGFIEPQEGLEILDLGGLNKLYEKIQVDIRQAQRENLKMAAATEELIEQHRMDWLEQSGIDPLNAIDEQGNPLQPPLVVPVNVWDNHEIHIREHNNYRKSQAFDMASPAVKRLFEQHVRMHQEAIVGAMMGNPLDPAGSVDPTMVNPQQAPMQGQGEMAPPTQPGPIPQQPGMEGG